MFNYLFTLYCYIREYKYQYNLKWLYNSYVNLVKNYLEKMPYFYCNIKIFTDKYEYT